MRAEEQETAFEAELIFHAVVFVEFAPVFAAVAREELARLLACFLKSGQLDRS